ncbi:HEAT repeat domain-containing protein [Dactylosporangium roseum]|uniref:HEAT repeat domain-containing protein n=1 Tax=Dactylosporangium roseum TaxID=47989 RepID=A0ABY5ZAZ6_9ACTN|nr:HEAT repeat domain-containing protein [Dactylosporangium roseum]UWZ37977.1 HEAT repeat domain-containing protein [Dactylosporangium roseum]
MGALGAQRVADDLAGRGHHIIELERYAMANKIWTTKVKRLRMADLLCVSCGRRFEAKAKSKLEVKLSDSKQAGRGWSDGMRPDDVFAFLPVTVDSNNMPLGIGRPLYLATASMNRITPKQGQLKSAADGSERDVYWPITVAKRAGIVTRIQSGKVTVQPPGAKASTLGRPGDQPLVQVGDHVENGTVLSSTVTPATNLNCSGATWNLHEAIASNDEVEAFAAVKAAGVLKAEHLVDPVRAIAHDDERDMRLRIEALGSLARLSDPHAVDRLADLDDGDVDAAMQMERVLLLSELVGSQAATESLLQIAKGVDYSDEVRAAAVWGLGAAWHDHFGYCWSFAFDASEKVRRHAQASLGAPTQNDLPDLVAALKEVDRAPLAAALLARSRSVAELAAALSDDQSHAWAIQSLGQIDPAFVRQKVSQLCAEDQAALDALWRRNLRDTHNEPTNLTELQFLAGQSLRAPESVRP